MILLKPWQSRVIVAGFIALSEYISYKIVHDISDVFYFIICGIFNSVIIATLSIVKGTHFISDLQKINFVALLVQFSGWVLYEFYFEPLAYNSMIFALNAAQILRLIWIDNDRYNQNFIDIGNICSPDFYFMGKNSKEEIHK